MNLYRNAHAIDGGWGAVNRVFIAETDSAVMDEISKLHCGENLQRHISNLKGGRTKADSIDASLLPYDGAFGASTAGVGASEMGELKSALENFEPSAQGVERIKSLAIVRRFGARWAAGVRRALKDERLAEIWRNVVRADKALTLWARGSEILSSTRSDLLAAEIQADMPEYETYLPMFGKDGLEMLNRLRQFSTL